MPKSLILTSAFLLLLSTSFFVPGLEKITVADESPYFSPCALLVDSQEGKIFVAGQTAYELRSYTLDDYTNYTSYSTPLPPKAIALAGNYLLLACSHSEGSLLWLDRYTLEQKARITVGHGACDVEVSPDLKTAYVANQFSNDISLVDLASRKESARIKVLRQPKQIVLSQDGKYLFAANFLPEGRADVDTVAAAVSVIDLQSRTCIKHIPLANGSNALRGMCLSAEGDYVMITHNLGRFQLPTTQLEQGWMNTSALSIIDARAQEFLATILLDEPEKGAAGSWGLDCTSDHVFITHSGTHDFSAIDYKALVDKLKKHANKADLAYDLTFLLGIRERIPVKGNGPRVLEESGGKLYLASYFSDDLNVFSSKSEGLVHAERIKLSDQKTQDVRRKGEQYFHDASFCFQSWQSCTGCHPDNARTDGLNWDLLNDGMGNPRNCKSLLLSHRTSPSMITGIRPDAETAVRAGFEFIQFMNVHDSISLAVDQYLNSLEAIPSPYLIEGKLSPEAEQGEKVFNVMGCAECHPAPYYTDQKKHTMGSLGTYDRQNSWDTPTLQEIWRTGPYMHDGRCATMEEVFTREMHGLQEELPEQQLEQLVSYVLSL